VASEIKSKTKQTDRNIGYVQILSMKSPMLYMKSFIVSMNNSTGGVVLAKNIVQPV